MAERHIYPAGETVPMSTRRMWMAGGIMALTNFMVVLDIAIANVSVPHIAGSLAISPDQGTWVITSYSVAEAICVPLTGWLVSRFGAVRTFLFCMIGFGMFSVLCGSSVTLGMLVACRVGQGFCGGPMMPLTQTMMVRIFPPKSRGTAMGLWAMTAVAAPIAGPLLGGVISDELSWHWIFFINVPVAIFCVFGALALLREAETPIEKHRIDLVGLGLLVVWVGALQIMLDIGRDHDWFGSTEIWILALIAGVGFIVFVIWELTEERPAVDIRVFRHRGFTVSVLTLAFIYSVFFSAIVVTPQWLQGYLGYTASWAGDVLAWQGVFALVMAPVVGKLINKFDPRLMVTIGVLWLSFSMIQRLGWTSNAGYWTFAIPHLMNGFGMPMFFVPLTVLAMASVTPSETASGAGLQNFVRTLSGAVGASIATTLWSDHAATARAALAGSSALTPQISATLSGRGFTPEQNRALLSNLVDQQAVTLATIHLFEIATAMMIFAALFVWLVPKPKRAPGGGAAMGH